MDIATIIGLVICIVSIGGSCLTGGDIMLFVDIPSVYVVGGGCLGATMIKWPIEVLRSLMKVTMKSLFFTPVDPKNTIDELVKLAETARRESVFALEKVEVVDPFLKKAMTLAADNRPPEVLQAILQLEIDSMESRHKVGASIMDGIMTDGPAFGMIGTLIGLVIMLKNLSDPSSIGPAMAVALITTFYGSILANVFAGPIKNKISYRSSMEGFKMNIIIAGTLGIVAGENPRLIREKLYSFLPPADRAEEEEAEGAAKEGAAKG